MESSYALLFLESAKRICKLDFFAIRFLMSEVFQKAKNYQNLTTVSRSKEIFSLLQKSCNLGMVCLRTQSVISQLLIVKVILRMQWLLAQYYTASQKSFLSLRYLSKIILTCHYFTRISLEEGIIHFIGVLSLFALRSL